MWVSMKSFDHDKCSTAEFFRSMILALHNAKILFQPHIMDESISLIGVIGLRVLEKKKNRYICATFPVHCRHLSGHGWIVIFVFFDDLLIYLI
jgi:hypothetical protein